MSTLLERWDAFVDGESKEMSANAVRRAIAIAQAAEEVFPSWQSHHYDRILRRAEELLEEKK